MAILGARNLASYNQKIDELGPTKVREILMNEENHQEGMEKMSGGDWIESFECDEEGERKDWKTSFDCYHHR